MYEYEFVKINLDGIPFLERRPRGDYHRIIDEYANEGWNRGQIFESSVSRARLLALSEGMKRWQ